MQDFRHLGKGLHGLVAFSGIGENDTPQKERVHTLGILGDVGIELGQGLRGLALLRQLADVFEFVGLSGDRKDQCQYNKQGG